MSYDLMLTCPRRGESKESNRLSCVFIDEGDGDTLHHHFSRRLGRLAGRPIDRRLIARVRLWLAFSPAHPALQRERMLAWLESHEGETISLEAWRD